MQVTTWLPGIHTMKPHACPPTRPAVVHGDWAAGLHWRRLRPADAESLRAFYRSQSAPDRRLRFHAAVKEVSRHWLDQLLRVGDQAHLAFAATWGSAEGAPLVAEAVMAFDADGASAEIGLMVDAAWRGRGVGAWCLTQIEREAQAQRLGCLRADVLPGNQAMSALLQQSGFEPGIHAQGDLQGQLVLRLHAAQSRSLASRCLRLFGAGLAGF